MLTQEAASKFLPEGTLSPLSGFQIKLQNAIVLPDRSVPYEEILNFKARHSSELLALRGYLDELSLEVSRNGFGGYEETVAFEKFQKSLNDHSEAMRQANFLKRLFSLDVSYSVSDAIKAAAATGAIGAIGASAQLSIPLIAASAAVAGISFAIKPGLKRKKENGNPFEYIFKAHDLL